MPLREFVCESCGALFEELMSSTEPIKQVPCKACGGRGLLKVSVVSLNSPKAPDAASNPIMDVVIGKNAEKAWGMYRDLKAVKEPIIKETGRGVTVDVARGGVRATSAEEVAQRKRAFALMDQK
jgi:putative FmdB family regulatory protein